jgi:hypothetical protein
VKITQAKNLKKLPSGINRRKFPPELKYTIGLQIVPQDRKFRGTG